MANNNEEKKKALDAAIAKLEKDFGKGTVMRLGESGAHVAGGDGAHRIVSAWIWLWTGRCAKGQGDRNIWSGVQW